MSKLRLFSLALMIGLVAAGCRGDDDDTPTVDGGPNGADAPGGSEVTVQEIQDSAMPVGTPVTLRGVVVVAIDAYGASTGSVIVMEPAGGAFSGITVFGGNAASISVGDLVDVSGGIKDEFALSDDDTGRTLTELKPADGGSITFTKVGDGTVPAAQVLEPWTLAASDAEAEKWDSVLIRFDNVAVVSTPHNVTQTDSTLLEMDITGPYLVQSAFTAFNDGIARDDCYASITGVGDYFFDYKVLPRSAADLVTGGTGCLYEDDAAMCGDTVDNDYDGHVDCADFSCQVAVAECTTDATVTELQDGTVVMNTSVVVAGAVVTAVDRDREHFWVQDAGGAAEYNGIYVYRGSAASELPAGVVVGATVDLAGRVEEYYEATQLDIEDGSLEVVGDGATPDPLTGADPTALGHADNGEPYEYVLVRLENIKVVNGELDFGQFTLGDAATPLIVDDTLFSYDRPDTGDCLASIVGIMTYSFDERKLLPRRAEDIVGGGTCP